MLGENKTRSRSVEEDFSTGRREVVKSVWRGPNRNNLKIEENQGRSRSEAGRLCRDQRLSCGVNRGGRVKGSSGCF